MTDIKPFIADKLKVIAPVELSFAETRGRLPVICITETGNSTAAAADNRELVSRITIQLDIYAETVKETEELSAEVSRILTLVGLRRSFSELITDEDRIRRCMRFTCGIEETTGRIVVL